MGDDEIIIFKGRRSFWDKFFASAAFTFGLICLYYIIFTPNWFSQHYGSVSSWILITLGSFAAGRYFARTLNYEIDLENSRYKSQSKNLFTKWDEPWKYFNYVEFVSVQKSGKKIFKVNIWFNKKRNTLSAKFNSYESAMNFAKKAARSLETKLYDHTVGKGKVEMVDF